MAKVNEQATPAGDLSDWRIPIDKDGENPASVLVSELLTISKQRVIVDVSTAQLMNLDKDFVEIIPSPGIGNSVEILAIQQVLGGNGNPTIVSANNHPNAATINQWAYITIFYVNDEALDKPLYRNEYVSLFFDKIGDFLSYDAQTFSEIIGSQRLIENKPLQLGILLNSARPTSPNVVYYTEAAWDEFISTVGRTLRIVVDYRVIPIEF